jgi:hypothetical protein
MKKQCLLIETPDHRKFFTHEKNYPQLLEFSNTFGAEISLVQAEDPDILTLEKLAPALCDPNYKQKVAFELVKPPATKKKAREASQLIRTWIKKQMTTPGTTLNVGRIQKAFPQLSLTKAAFCNHFKIAREEMAEAGYKIAKQGNAYATVGFEK